MFGRYTTGRLAFPNVAKAPKYAPEIKRTIQRLLVESPIPRDKLPYTDEFDRLKKVYQTKMKVTVSDHEFWTLLSKIGKYGGAGGQDGRKKAPDTRKLTEDEKLEIRRLFPEGIGHRDNLPYTPEFDDLYRRFTQRIHAKFTKHEFWRATSHVAKLSRKPKPVFDTAPLGGLPEAMVHYLERTNPWWKAQPAPPPERYRRWAFRDVLNRLDSRVAPVVAVRGPRQVGKTTIQLQIVEELLLIRNLNASRILRVQFDDTPALGSFVSPIETIVRWYEENVLKEPINAVAARGERVYLLFDEVQNLPDWSAQLKALVDHTAAATLVTGSSALRIRQGQDNLAGRVSSLELGPLQLGEIAGVRDFGDLPRFTCPNTHDDWGRADFWHDLNSHAKRHAKVLGRAYSFFSQFGGYPVCHKPSSSGTTSLLAGQLVEDVVNKSIETDPVKVGPHRLIDRGLIREVFRLVCRYAGQSVSKQQFSDQISAILGTGVKHTQVEEAMEFLANAMLMHRIPPLELLRKQQKNPLKIALCDHFVRNAWLKETIPLDPSELTKLNQAVSSMAGHLVESVVGYKLKGEPTVEVSWFPARKDEPEIDYVMTLGVKRIPIEIKYQATVSGRDAKAADTFCSKPHYEASFGLVVTQNQVGKLGDSCIAVPAAHLLLAL